jgi:hypothetical protein
MRVHDARRLPADRSAQRRVGARLFNGLASLAAQVTRDPAFQDQLTERLAALTGVALL